MPLPEKTHQRAEGTREGRLRRSLAAATRTLASAGASFMYAADKLSGAASTLIGQKPPLSLPPSTTGAGGPAAEGQSALGLGTAGTLFATGAAALAALVAMTQSIDEKSHLPGLEQVKKANEDYVGAQERLTRGQRMLATSRDSMQAFGLINEIAGLRESIARSTQVPQRERDVSFSWPSDAVSKVITQIGHTTQPGIATMLLGAGYQPPAAAPDWSTVPATALAGMLVLGVLEGAASSFEAAFATGASRKK